MKKHLLLVFFVIAPLQAMNKLFKLRTKQPKEISTSTFEEATISRDKLEDIVFKIEGAEGEVLEVFIDHLFERRSGESFSYQQIEDFAKKEFLDKVIYGETSLISQNLNKEGRENTLANRLEVIRNVSTKQKKHATKGCCVGACCCVASVVMAKSLGGAASMVGGAVCMVGGGVACVVSCLNHCNTDAYYFSINDDLYPIFLDFDKRVVGIIKTHRFKVD